MQELDYSGVQSGRRMPQSEGEWHNLVLSLRDRVEALERKQGRQPAAVEPRRGEISINDVREARGLQESPTESA